jgi:hypothetical protein
MIRKIVLISILFKINYYNKIIIFILTIIIIYIIRKVKGYINWSVSQKKTKNRLNSMGNIIINKTIESENEEKDEENKMKERNKNQKEKLSPKNNALRFTLYTDRKGIIDTNHLNTNNDILPTISQSQKYKTEATDHNIYNSFGSYLKGGIDFRRNLGRKKDLQIYNNNPSIFDYSPKYQSMNKYAGIDDEYKKKKYKLMKLLKSYECRSEYQMVDLS